MSAKFALPLQSLRSLANQKEDCNRNDVKEKGAGCAEDISIVHPSDRLHLIRIASYHEGDSPDEHPGAQERSGLDHHLLLVHQWQINAHCCECNCTHDQHNYGPSEVH